MSKFENRLLEHYKILKEEPGAEELPADPTATEPAADPAAPTETPETGLPDQEGAGDDDTSKMKVDYVEMIRKALIMAPKHIDDVDYAKLTKIVDTENLEEMQELVSRIVRNNYPHPDL